MKRILHNILECIDDDAATLDALGDGFSEDQTACLTWAMKNLPERKMGELNDGLSDARETALYLKQLNADAVTVLAALWVECEIDAIERDQTLCLTQIGRSVLPLVHCLDNLGIVGQKSTELDFKRPDQAERLRRMLLAMVSDVRAMLILLARETRRLHHIKDLSKEDRSRIARVAIDIYSPLANRLGLGQLKWELEDLAFRQLEPESYKRIAKALEERRADRETYIDDFVSELDARLRAEGFEGFEIYGRPKHIYSIWNKLERKDVDLQSLYDVRAVRVLLSEKQQCYTALGIVHEAWNPISSEFDDYIAKPKPNGYMSLHTAVMGPHGKAVEVQIRTLRMHEDAEYGFAAHWRYKEGSAEDARMQRNINALRNLLENFDSDDSFIENISVEFFADRVFVFTPRGDVIDLPSGSTPIDFAYAVHTEVGHRCRGAKVNGQIVTLNHVLKHGDKIDVLTRTEPRPSRDWLNKNLGYMRSPRARAKVRNWLNLQNLEQQIEEGKLILDRELRRMNVPKMSLETLIKTLKCKNERDLYSQLARGDISADHLTHIIEQWRTPHNDEIKIPLRKQQKESKSSGVSVRGVDNLLTKIAVCCHPVPYDSVIGYITQGKGVSVHREDCKNIVNMHESEKARLIDVSWDARPISGGQRYTVGLKIMAYDRQGLLRDVSALTANESVNVIEVHTLSHRDNQTAEMQLRVEISDVTQLTRLMDKLRQLTNIIDVIRS